MIMAAPAMNPTIAACEKKSTRKPNLQTLKGKQLLIRRNQKIVDKEKLNNKGTINYLNIPNRAWKVPAKKVAVKTSFL
jgi:hypothetical protein